MLPVWILATCLFASAAAGAGSDPSYTDDGQLIRPVDYREWVYLSSGLGMSYGTAAQQPVGTPPFDNVFVKPESYRAFLKSGRWPDKTMFILEIRGSSSHGSINRNGHFQTGLLRLEAAVKDESRFPAKWAYVEFPGRADALAVSAKPFPSNSRCNACHSANGAVENTFVQFYPTLLEIAKRKGTVKSSQAPPLAEAGERTDSHRPAGLK